jgi:ELWxxDGT repeat protein
MKTRTLLFIVFYIIKTGYSQDVSLVKDVFERKMGSYPQNLTNVNGTLFFSANNGTNGRELWKSDGTDLGTVMVKDICTIADRGADPQNLTNVNGVLFFSADNGINGSELWKSNGISAGTSLVKNIMLPDAHIDLGSNPKNLTNVNGILFFSSENKINGRELWKSDGTAVGTVIVKDIVSGKNSSNPEHLINFNGSLFFTVDNGINGRELWKSDGTSAGTVLVKDILAGSLSSNPSMFTNANGTLFFITDNGKSGVELWKSNGTSSSTVFIKDFNLKFAERNYSVTNTDGYINYMVENNYSLPYMNGHIFFNIESGQGWADLWKSNGTEDGTVQFSKADRYIPSGLTEMNSALFFIIDKVVSSGEVELWKSDGTKEGTKLFQKISGGVLNLTGVNGILLFSKHNGELWQCDGTLAGTKCLKTGLRTNSLSEFFTYINGIIYFRADDAIHGSELWKLEVKRN